MNYKELEKIAAKLRVDIVKAIYNAGSGHPGGSLSAADIVTALYFAEMNVNPQDPNMKGRDKLILSKGHAGPAQYAALGEKGYFPVEEFITTLRKINSKFQGHPDRKKVPGIEMSTGSLGQGLSAGCGMAMANRMDNDKGRVYVILGDGEVQEGMIWEAAMSAAHYELDNLVAILDWNGIQIDGRNEEVMTITPITDKFAAFGWHVVEADGHNMESILNALEEARETKGKPTAIIAKTIKGKGVSFMEDTNKWHGKAPNEEEAKQAVKELGGEW